MSTKLSAAMTDALTFVAKYGCWPSTAQRNTRTALAMRGLVAHAREYNIVLEPGYGIQVTPDGWDALGSDARQTAIEHAYVTAVRENLPASVLAVPEPEPSPLNQAQTEALDTLTANHGMPTGESPNTLAALVRRGLIEDMSGGNRVRYALTDAGVVVWRRIHGIPTDRPEPVNPVHTDPFKPFESTYSDPAVRAAIAASGPVPDYDAEDATQEAVHGDATATLAIASRLPAVTLTARAQTDAWTSLGTAAQNAATAMTVLTRVLTPPRPNRYGPAGSKVARRANRRRMLRTLRATHHAA